jgi:serine protease inhibitor
MDEFGFRLLAKLRGGNRENVIVSPLSVSVALAMTYNGADVRLSGA